MSASTDAERDLPAYCSNTDTDEEQEEEQDKWSDWNDSAAGDEDEEPAQSLFDNTALPSAEAAFQHDANAHGFDIRQYAIQERLDEYGIFRCINFIRSEVAAGRDPLTSLKGGVQGAAWLTSDDYLRPAMQDDALLFFDYEDVVATWRSQQDAAAGGAAGASPGPSSAALEDEVSRLRSENEGLREALATLAAACIPDELKDDAGRPAPSASAGAPSDSGPSTSRTGAAAGPSRLGRDSGLPPPGSGRAEVERAYFESYGGFGIHQEMISDKPRTESYQRALECNPSLIKGKAVLDVGCGTGILSMFAARAGAATVVAVDGSERIAGFAKQICKANGFSSEDGGPMTVLHGKVEELPGLPVDKVDVIVSEWMGYALLFETMLDTVLHARDRFLRPGGAVLPDLATIHVAGASEEVVGTTFWKEVYGFNMSPIAEEVRKGRMRDANVLLVKADSIVTEAVQVKELDLCTMKAEEQDFTADFTLVARPGSGAGPVACHALVLWFDTDFSPRHCSEASVKLSTSPYAHPTHWAQTVMVLPEPVTLAAPGQAASAEGPAVAQSISGRISMVRDKSKHRSLDISLEYSASLSDGRQVKHTMLYGMSVITAP